MLKLFNNRLRTTHSRDADATLCCEAREKPLLSAHLPALNALRGIAVLLVFLFHAGVPGFTGGFIGVDIFFVLSGFLITILLIQEYQAHGTIRFSHFYIRRLLRLFPALLILLLVFVVFSLFFFETGREKIIQMQDALLTLSYASSWTRAFDLDRPAILGHSWSLSVEEQFYLLWPLLLFFLMRLPRLWRSVGIGGLLLTSWGWRLVLLGQGAGWNRLYNGFDCRVDMLLSGCLLASLWNAGYLKFWIENRSRARCMVVLSGMLLVCFSFAAHWQTPALYQYQYELIALATVVVILEILSRQKGWLVRMLSIRPLIWLGNVSYGFYLWHYPVLYFSGEMTDLGKGAHTLTAALVTLIFTTLSWYGPEWFFLRFKDRFAGVEGMAIIPGASRGGKKMSQRTG